MKYEAEKKRCKEGSINTVKSLIVEEIFDPLTRSTGSTQCGPLLSCLEANHDFCLTLTWSVMLQMVITVSRARRKSSVTFSPRATEQRVSRLLRTTSLSALLIQIQTKHFNKEV